MNYRYYTTRQPKKQRAMFFSCWIALSKRWKWQSSKTKQKATHSMDQAKEIVGHMMKNDAFSQWLGITVVSNAPGEATLKMTVRDEMTNGFHIAHGGITYSLADSALAFASNGSGRQSLSIETSIHHLHAVRAGEELTAFATLLSETHKTGLYQIDITTTSGQRVAWFKGTVYRTSKEWNL